MTEAKRALPVILAHFFLGLGGCIAYAFFLPVTVALIPPFITPYRVRSGLLLFITYMPALLLSGMLVGYALAFSKNASDSIERWSNILLSYLKGAFGICLFFIAVYVVLSEGVSPILASRQSDSLSRSEDYTKYLAVARDSIALENYSEADFQVRGALMIWKESPEATALGDQVQYKLAAGGTKPAEGTKKGSASDAMLRRSSGLTVLDALDKAEAAEKATDYYNAHYYAMLAYRLAADTDPNKANALRMAANAWNHISSGTDLIAAQGDATLYNTKRVGYDTIQSGDFLKAYYIFLALQEQEKAATDGKHDPDVERFLEVARKGVLESFFFTDETVNMSLFESARNVFFVIKKADGTNASIFIKGVTYTRADGKDMAFLRDFEYVQFDRNNAVQYQISVPYVKMFPYTQAKGRPRPELLLRAVDRDIAGSAILPFVVSGEVPERDQNILVLEMPYDDFNSIVTANRGAESMPLIDLYRFVDRAEVYGFSRSVYLTELIDRLADPFLILIVSIYALILGWRYRLAQSALFKFWWILMIPLFPVLSLCIIETLRYITRLSIMVIIGLAPQHPLMLTVTFLGIWFTGMSVYFFSQRS